MLTFQREELPDRSQYFLDGAMENYHLNILAYDTLNLFGDREAINSAVESGEKPWGYVFEQGMKLSLNELIALRLNDLARQALETLPEYIREALLLRAYRYEVNRIEEGAELFAGWFYVDNIEGGCFKSFRDKPRLNLRTYEPFRAVERRLHAPNAIRRYMKTFDEADKYIKYNRLLTSTMKAFPFPKQDTDLTLLKKLQRDQFELFRISQLTSALGRFPRSDVAKHRLLELMDEYPIKAAMGRYFKEQRKVIKRSTQTAVNLVGPKLVSDFVAGQEIILPGEKLDLKLERAGGLSTVGHGAMEVRMQDKTGQYLGKLCVYFENTPSLDQLTAFALMMQTGSETDIINSANMIELTPAGSESKLFKERKQPDRTIPDYAEALIGDSIELEGKRRRRVNVDQSRLRNNCRVYTERVKPIFTGILLDSVWGTKNAKVLHTLTSRAQ